MIKYNMKHKKNFFKSNQGLIFITKILLFFKSIEPGLIQISLPSSLINESLEHCINASIVDFRFYH